MLADLLMIIHGVALWIVFSFWLVLTWSPTEPEDQPTMVWVWWTVTILVGTLASTFYVLQMR